MLAICHSVLAEPKIASSACYGNFSAPKCHEVAAIRGPYLVLLGQSEDGSLNQKSCHNTFSHLRSVTPLRILGDKQDLLVATADNGDFSVLRFDNSLSEFILVECEPFGKSGIRRTVPGVFVAVDPLGRSLMITAQEKQKLVYMIRRDLKHRVIISSPLESHRSGFFTRSIDSIPVGFHNPTFAVIESDHSSHNTAVELSLYEVELGTNSVTRRSSEMVPSSAHRVISVPSTLAGAGVLVCCRGFLLHISPGKKRVIYEIPSDVMPIVVSHSVQSFKEGFLIILQTDLGVLYSLSANQDHTLSLRTCGTVPRSSCMVLTRSGYLFSSSEMNGESLFQVVNPVFADTEALENISIISHSDTGQIVGSISTHDNNGPIFARICGMMDHSALAISRIGGKVEDLAAADLPGVPSGVWALRYGDYDKYIVVGFADSTLVLEVSDSVVEVFDTGFLSNERTLLCHSTPNGSQIQVTTASVVQVQSRSSNIWRSCYGEICCASADASRLILCTNEGRSILFSVSSDCVMQPLYVSNRNKSTVVAVTICLDLVIAGFSDSMLRVYSIERGSQLTMKSAVKLGSICSSCLGMTVGSNSLLLIGTDSGDLIRFHLTKDGSRIKQESVRRVGSRPTKLVRMRRLQDESVAILNSRIQVSLVKENRLHDVLFQGRDTLDYLCQFNSEDLSSLWVGTFGSNIFVSTLSPDPVASTTILLGRPSKCLTLFPSVIPGNPDCFGVASDAMECINCKISLFSFGASRITDIDLGPIMRVSAMSICRFSQLKDRRPCLVVAVNVHEPHLTVKTLLRTYIYDSDFKMHLVHTTDVTSFGEITRISELSGNIVVSSRSTSILLSVYELGKSKLLKKFICHTMDDVGHSWMASYGKHLFTGDVHAGVKVYTFEDQTLRLIARDCLNRSITAGSLVDELTCAVADKFGNVVLLRLLQDLTRAKSFSLREVAHIHIGEIIAGISNDTHSQMLHCFSTQGSIHVLNPLKSLKRWEALLKFQSRLGEMTSSLGRPVLLFRSRDNPIQGFVDGEILDRFHHMKHDEKELFASSEGMSPHDITSLINLAEF